MTVSAPWAGWRNFAQHWQCLWPERAHPLLRYCRYEQQGPFPVFFSSAWDVFAACTDTCGALRVSCLTSARCFKGVLRDLHSKSWLWGRQASVPQDVCEVQRKWSWSLSELLGILRKAVLAVMLEFVTSDGRWDLTLNFIPVALPSHWCVPMVTKDVTQ